MQSAFSISKSYTMVWPVTHIDGRAVKYLTDWVNKSHDYARLDENAPSFTTLLETMARQHMPLTEGQARSLRSIALKSKIIRRHHKMGGAAPRMEYDAGHPIMELSAKYDFPPLGLLRSILSRRYSAALLHDIFANKVAPTALEPRDCKEFSLAEKGDAESFSNQKRVAEIAFKNEHILVDFFKSAGVDLLTQDDLVKAQMAEFGRAVSTPDILFQDSVSINGAPVHWIDYKDYVGTSAGFLYKSNSEQAGRCVAKWGPGAMCYRHGVVEGVSIPHTLMLDATTLPLSFVT